MFVMFRRTMRWRGKKFNIRVPMKSKVTYDAGFFYCPYVPLF